jgi:hypothetical protein
MAKLTESAREMLKGRNFGHLAAVMGDDHDDPYKKLHVRGRVTEMIDGDDAWHHIDALNRRYHQTDQPYRRRPGMQRVIVKIEPTVTYEGP